MTPIQSRAIAALLTTRSVSDAAAHVGISERTMFRWLAEPTFRRELADAEHELLDAAQRQLLLLQTDAISVLATMLRDADAPHAARLRAAQIVLDSLLKLRELRDLERRLTAIENAMEAAE